MNPIDKKIKEIERQLQELREMRDLKFSENLGRYKLDGVIDAGVVDSGSSLNDSTPDGQTVNAPKTYNQRVRVIINNNPYYIGLYNA
jgi:hypothetical protein